MVCNRCGCTLNDGAAFCHVCGEKAVIPEPETVPEAETVSEIVEEKIFCSNCGLSLEGVERFCPECGTPIVKEEPAADAPENDVLPEETQAEVPAEDPAPEVLVSDISNCAVNLNLRFWTSTENYWGAYWSVKAGMKTVIESSGLHLPLPQRVVTYVNAPEEK